MASFDFNTIIECVVKKDVKGLNEIKSELCRREQVLSEDMKKLNKTIKALLRLYAAKQQRLEKELEEVREYVSKIDNVIKALS